MAETNTARTLEHEILAQVDPWLWAYLNRIVIVGGLFRLDDHEYLVEIMRTNTPLRTVMKATQGGMTEAEVLRVLHGMRFGIYPVGCVYVFPTKEDVSDFSSSRFDPLIEKNYEEIGAYVGNTDRNNLKQIGTGFLYFRSGLISKEIREEMAGSTKTTAKLKGLPADHAVLDEFDEMSPGVEAFVKGRLAHSKVGTICYLANPTLPDFGIAEKYDQSDQRRWHITCQSCGHLTCLDRDKAFPDCLRRLKDGTVFRACSHCGKPLDPRFGQWIADFPTRSGAHAGFQISHLSMPFQNAAEILADYENPKTNRAIFTRLRLGRPFFDARLLGCYFATEIDATEKEGRLLPHISEPRGATVDTWWDIGMDDSTAIWMTTPGPNGMTDFLAYYEGTSHGVGFYIKVLRRLGEQYGWSYRYHTGPHDLAVREFSTGISRVEHAWNAFGFRFRVMPRPENKGDSIEAARAIMGNCRFDLSRAEAGFKSLKMYRREYDEKRKAFKNQPLHDWASHAADAFQVFAIAQAPWAERKQTQQRVRNVFGS